MAYLVMEVRREEVCRGFWGDGRFGPMGPRFTALITLPPQVSSKQLQNYISHDLVQLDDHVLPTIDYKAPPSAAPIFYLYITAHYLEDLGTKNAIVEHIYRVAMESQDSNMPQWGFVNRLWKAIPLGTPLKELLV